MGILQQIAQSVEQSDFVKGLETGFGYKPDKQQLSEWKQAAHLKRLYNSPEFNSMPPLQRAQFEKKLYDEHIAPTYTSAGKKPPSFSQWVDFRTSKDFDKMLPKMYDYFEDRSSNKQQFVDASMRVGRSFTNLAENLYIKGILHDNPKGDKVTHWLDNFKKAESHIIDKNSPVNADWGTRFYESIEDNSADFVVFKELEKIIPALGSVNKVKGADAFVGGALGKLDLAQELAQTKLGRFALNRLIGASEGYLYSQVQRTPNPKIDALTFSMFPRAGDPAIKKLLAEQMVMLGPKATVALMQKGVEEAGAKKLLTLPEPKFEEMAKDVLTTKLTKANAEIYNSAARQLGYSMYNTAPQAIKGKILQSIYLNMEQVLRNPLANADPVLQKFMVEHNLTEHITPEMMAGFKESAEAQAKAGVKPSLDNLVSEQVAIAKLEQPENNPRLAAMEERIVPGAASGKSPEFIANYPKPSSGMRLEGDLNKTVFALGHYLQKDPKSPLVGRFVDYISRILKNQNQELSKAEIKKLPLALQQHMNDLITTGHTNPEDVRGVFRSTNLSAVFGKGSPTEWQDELQEEVEEVQKIKNKKK